MQQLPDAKLPIWNAARLPPSEPQHLNKDGVFDYDNPVRPFVVQFHRWATLLLMTLGALSIAAWGAMRVIYPQPEPHIDDLSGYEALVSGKTTTPETYIINGSHIIYIENNRFQKYNFQLSLYSKTLCLADLLRRWGRSDYNERGTSYPDWHLEWRETQYTVDTFVSRLNLNARVKWITITSN